MKRSAHRSRVFELLVGLAVLGLGLLGLGSPATASGWESAGPAHHYDTVVGVGPTVRVSDIEATANRLVSQARRDSRGLELDSGSVRSFVAPRIPAGLVGAQRTAFSNADSIYRSSDFGAIRNAHASGVAAEVRIGGTTVIYEPGMPASGMTLFGEDAFVLGPQAFVSEAELAQTLLHESHRLATSARSGSALVTSETQSAFDFAAQNYQALLGG